MNHILVPLNNMDYLDAFIQAGADEFYMGFYDDEWIQEFGDYAEINRMSGFKKGANRYSFCEILENIKKIKNKNKSIYITMNSASYSKSKINKIEYYFKMIKEAGATGVIVSTIQEVELANKYSLETVASTLCAIYNNFTSNFFKKIGATRQILPRDISLNEIEDIVKSNPKVRYEVFLMRNGCQFSDSHCLGFHRPEFGSLCGTLNRASLNIISKEKGFKKRHDIELNSILYTQYYHHISACGLCALYRFVKMGIYAYKIVGRNDMPEGICKDIEIVKKNIEIAKKCKSEDEYLEKMLIQDRSFIGCKKGLGCYYPEVRF